VLGNLRLIFLGVKLACRIKWHLIMTVINLQKSPLLMQLLKNMAIGLSQVNKQDPAIAQHIQEIKSFLRNPMVDSNQISSMIDRAKEVISSYNINPSGNKTPGNYVSSLPGQLFHAAAEVQHLIDSQRLSQPIRPRHHYQNPSSNVAQQPMPQPAGTATNEHVNTTMLPTHITASLKIAQLALEVERFAKHASRRS